MFALLNFLTSPIGKIVGIVFLIMSFVGMGWGMLKIHEAGIRREALASFNKQQLEIVLKEQESYNRQTRMLQETQIRIMEALAKKIEETEKKVSSVEDWLNSSEAKKSDRASSIVLKETLRRLGAPK
jgi:hypothetical protein